MTEEAPKVKAPHAIPFIADVMKRTGCETPTDLANLGGWTSPADLRKVYKWAAGVSAPNMQATITLLRLAGLLKEGAEAEADGLTPVRLPQDPLAALAAKVDRQGDATAKTLAGLAKDVRAIRRRLGPRDTEATGGPG